MDQVIYSYRNSNESSRVRITGTLTYYESGTLAVVEQDGLAMLVETPTVLPLHTGMTVEATGFPEIADGSVRLIDGQLRQRDQSSHVDPKTINWEDAAAGKFAYNLVAMQGEIVAVVHDSTVDLFIVRSDGHLFSATVQHNSSDALLSGSAGAELTVGSRVRVTGICFVDQGDHWRGRLWFDVRMRSLQDISLLEQPSWWTVKRLTFLTMVLSVIILIAIIWAGLLDRRLRKQNAVLARQSQEDAIRERRMARQEQQRSHILELINSPEPLPEVLAEIRAMVSTRLFGAPCWFELSAHVDDAETARPTAEGVVFQDMFAPDGANLGRLFAAPLPRSAPDTELAAALTAGARLAELAIDTRRLYSDLRHRSEYDLLTDIPNRFSMEKHLDRLMQGENRNRAGEADSTAGMFGLIYVDLDKFKQINDRYGHRTGDLYLQAVTARMKFQLRTGDILARIGGDEFIALVPILHGRADVEEIAVRLEHCFDEPFDIEGFKLQGSASVGLAVYPEDGSTKEDLQRSADAFMYAHKERKRHQEKVDDVMHRVWGEDLMP
jgi:diguanylate cyclase (GGDEF)-like protein